MRPSPWPRRSQKLRTQSLLPAATFPATQPKSQSRRSQKANSALPPSPKATKKHLIKIPIKNPHKLSSSSSTVLPGYHSQFPPSHYLTRCTHPSSSTPQKNVDPLRTTSPSSSSSSSASYSSPRVRPPSEEQHE